MLGDLNKMEVDGGTVKTLKEKADNTYKAIKQFQFIEKLYRSAMPEVRDGSGRKIILPDALANNIYMAKGRILNDNTLKEFWPALEEQAKFYKSIAPEFEKKPSSFAARVGGGGLGYLMGGPQGVVAFEGLGALSAYSLMKPKSQKVIAGIVKQSTKAGVKTGLHLGGEQIDFGRPD